VRKNNRRKSMFWKPIVSKKGSTLSGSNSFGPSSFHERETFGQTSESKRSILSHPFSSHPLVNQVENQKLRTYEVEVKDKFDNVEALVRSLLNHTKRNDFVERANNELKKELGITLDNASLDLAGSTNLQFAFRDLYANIFFKLFLNVSGNFFRHDPLGGQHVSGTLKKLLNAGYHAIGIAPCADGRLAHVVSYVLRLPYGLVRRKAHAGALFDVSESVRNWVFVEHSRFREGVPNKANEPTRYLKIAVYHYSKSDPLHQGCAAHGSDDHKAAEAALTKLRDFRQAIENRFGCGSTVETILLGLNTDDDSLHVHIPDREGRVMINRYVDTKFLYKKTFGLDVNGARDLIKKEILECNAKHHASLPEPGVVEVLSWFIENNFSQIEYVRHFENGCYPDLGHAERFIGIGDSFDEVQLRNLSYYSYLHTVEEGANDIDVGVKIFKGLAVKKGLPIPIIIRCNYDGRVPGSKSRAIERAKRLEKALQERYEDLYAYGLLKIMSTLRDYKTFRPAESLKL